MRVLVVDDDPSTRSVVAAALSDMNVVAAPGGVEALEILMDDAFDVAVVDLMMPHVDGFSVVGHMRRHAQHRDTPIVLLTAKVNEADHLRGFRAGADAYVTKPFDVDSLAATVRGVAALTVAEREVARRQELGKAEILNQLEYIFG
jgi:DNA-binding response OmpR family regulator